MKEVFGEDIPERDREKFSEIFHECASKTITQEGLEVCLIANREEIPAFRGPGFHPSFEELLKKIDEAFGEIKRNMFEEHIL